MEYKHIPIMLNECLENLKIKENGIYVDGTLGGAGHSSEILKRIPKGFLIGIDKDNEALDVSRQRLSKYGNNFIAVKGDHKDIKEIVNSLGYTKVDGILLDLGMSSYQIDNKERGFSYMSDAKLDMRMDSEQELTAEYIINNYSESELLKILYEYGEENFAKSIVKNIILQRKIKKIETTFELSEIIKKSIPAKFQKNGNPCKKTFQALRIEVNGELIDLKNTLIDCISLLSSGGRLCVITFHSLEDRIVKNTFKEQSLECTCPPRLPICVCGGHNAKINIITKKPIEPSNNEQDENTRSRSSKLRVAEKK